MFYGLCVLFNLGPPERFTICDLVEGLILLGSTVLCHVISVDQFFDVLFVLSFAVCQVALQSVL